MCPRICSCPSPLPSRFQSNSWGEGNPNSLVALKPTLFPVRLQLKASAGCWFPHRLSPRVGPQMHLGLNFHDAAQEGTREAHRAAGGRGRSRSSLQVPGEEGGGRAARTRHLAAVESRTACGGGVRGSGPGVREEQMVRRREWEGGPRRCQIPGGRPHRHHGDGGRRSAPGLTLF